VDDVSYEISKPGLIMLEREKYLVYVDEEIGELIPEFLANRARDVELLREAVANADFQVMGRVAHKMKGAGGSYGFVVIYQYGMELGKAVLDRDTKRLAEIAESLSDYLEKVEVRYNP
jgi:HPt (histidine-containing phosphotransfer) domain-containing protein